ncbi:MAG: ead/Ea22-like family protein [Desulfovibrio sp.]|nr:ead/Ea22-like family protein [Desulfovibrio sp.]
MLIQEQLDDLRTRAIAATPGPWKPDYRQMYVFDEAEVNICCQIRGYGDMAYTHSDAAREAQMRANNAFIAAANPSVILQLLDMVKRLEKERNWLADRVSEDSYGDVICPYHHMPQDTKCPLWVSYSGESPENDTLEAWKYMVFGDYDDPIDCCADRAKCWRYVASKAVDGMSNDDLQQ